MTATVYDLNEYRRAGISLWHLQVQAANASRANDPVLAARVNARIARRVASAQRVHRDDDGPVAA